MKFISINNYYLNIAHILTIDKTDTSAYIRLINGNNIPVKLNQLEALLEECGYNTKKINHHFTS